MLNVILLSVATLLADFSSEMIVPILPFFIQSVGGAGVAIGLAFGIADAASSLIRVVSGHYSDKTGNYRLFIFAGYIFSAVAKFGYPLVNSLGQVSFMRSVEKAGTGFRNAPRDAIISESIGEKRRGEGFGIQKSLDSLGAIIGSFMVLVLFIYMDYPFEKIFLIAAIIASFGIVPILLVKIPERLRAKSTGIKLGKLTSRAKRFIFVATLFAIGNFSYAFLILRVQMSFFGLDKKEALYIALLLFIFLNIFESTFSMPAGILSDKIGRKRVIFLSYAVFAAVSLGFIMMSVFYPGKGFNFLIFLGLFAMYGLFKALKDSSQKAYISDLSDPSIRATSIGAYETMTGLAAIPSGLIAGILWNIDPVFTFAFGFVVTITAAFGISKVVSEFERA